VAPAGGHVGFEAGGGAAVFDHGTLPAGAAGTAGYCGAAGYAGAAGSGAMRYDGTGGGVLDGGSDPGQELGRWPVDGMTGGPGVFAAPVSAGKPVATGGRYGFGGVQGE
jgi:hypothetical protein